VLTETGKLSDFDKTVATFLKQVINHENVFDVGQIYLNFCISELFKRVDECGASPGADESFNST